MLAKENQEYIKDERSIQDEINNCLDNSVSFCFNAGAGAGKTYALVESLKYVLNSKKILTYANSKALCITYTNAAKNEMRDRLGNNEQVVITTIHDFMWELIKRQQPLLLKVHREKIVSELNKINTLLEEDKKCECPDELESLLDNPEFIEQFYKSYSLNKPEFIANMQEYVQGEAFEELKKRFGNFKARINSLIKKKNYTQTLSNIDNKETGFTKVKYKSTYNRDNLNKMYFSHDTLLEYANKIIVTESTDIYKKMIVDKYSVIFIDEYQDTTEDVVMILKMLDDFAKKKNYNFTIGYYGDDVQNIFNKGIGDKLGEKHPNLKQINKKYNRRSSEEIIGTINKIRNDKIVQKSIYEDASGGTVTYCIVKDEDNFSESIQKVTEDYIKKHKNINQVDEFACLLLKHEGLSEIQGFKELFDSIKDMPKYKGDNYKQINTEFLSNNDKNLGYFLLYIKNLIRFKQLMLDKNTPIKTIISYVKDDKDSRKLTFLMLRKFNEQFIKIENESKESTLSEYLERLIKVSKEEILVKNLLCSIFGLDKEIIELEDIKNSAVNFFKCEDNTEKVNVFFYLSIKQFVNWYKHLTREMSINMNYLTYHNSKGLEFDNLLVIYDNIFARDKSYFSKFLTNLEGEGLSESKEEKWREARNLLYVACSRARKNLCMVIKESDLHEISEGIRALGFSEKSI
ncbi:UvrD-helicase domain-containing protein [Vagococcus sp. PNs007]|uniref:DNA 3'-5' helicase n=1 Tax=Vagococcus proximus TaxID=2991417 RepID=A0ABT5X1P4_9ENTE|nr:UvrD-helicase domain-containing protein [Vagococcus proximus]MDF0479908.1 UvrD-helicase domain-containing protein [Vagococcus proximus]